VIGGSSGLSYEFAVELLFRLGGGGGGGGGIDKADRGTVEAREFVLLCLRIGGGGGFILEALAPPTGVLERRGLVLD